MSLQRAMTGAPPIAWEPDKGSHVGVMRRDAGVETMRWFTTDACYVFHPMNAWEEGEKIYADVMEYPVAPLFPNADGKPPKDAFARLVRWTFDLADNSNTIKRTPLDDLAGEFPRFDERRAGLGYRHGWFAGITRTASATCASTPSRTSTCQRPAHDHLYDAGDSPGEPVFVPRSADAAEGDGWLVAVVYRGAEDRSDFVVFDAQDVAAGPIATPRFRAACRSASTATGGGVMTEVQLGGGPEAPAAGPKPAPRGSA
jgi:carotenoid cleavage dioxygenase-like enzyme